MAGHLPINTRPIHRGVIKALKDIKAMSYFTRYPMGRGFVQRLNSDYSMNEEHGLIDDEIIAYTPEKRDKIFEIHLNKSGEINQVYLVM